MVDITKEEFWDNRYEELSRKEKQDSKIKEFISKHRMITTLLISLGILMTVNTILIYNFFRMLMNM